MNIEIKELTKEDIDQMMDEHNSRSIILGFENYEAMEEFKINAAMGLIKFGGSFANPLGHALSNADSFNIFKIIANFRGECEEHAELYKKWKEKRK